MEVASFRGLMSSIGLPAVAFMMEDGSPVKIQPAHAGAHEGCAQHQTASQ